MLYLVECKQKGSSKKEYISPFPEGTEAKDSKEAIQIVISSINSLAGTDGLMSSSACYFDFRAKPKKWEKYKTPMSSEDRKLAFEEKLMDELRAKGYEPDVCFHGIRVKTGVDTWIIETREAYDEDAQVIINHKNNWDANRDNNGRIPGFHKQASGKYTVNSLICFITGHENKWKAKGRRKFRYANFSR